MMRYALFIGCQIPSRVPQYETASRAVLKKLGVDVVDIRQFNCCGYPLRNVDKKAFLLSSVRNLALAEQEGLDMLVLCKCCFGSLKKAEHMMKEEGALQDEVRKGLQKTGLTYKGETRICHLLSVLFHEVGVDTLKENLSKTYKGLNIATHYGCHALRPSEVTRFDDPVAPSIFDKLVAVTGAKSVDWTNKLECCGAPLMGMNDELSMTLTMNKVREGKKAGADFLCTSCPYCQIQFDTVQDMIVSGDGNQDYLPSILFPQLLGLSMDIDQEELGLKLNRLDITEIVSYLNEE